MLSINARAKDIDNESSIKKKVNIQLFYNTITLPPNNIGLTGYSKFSSSSNTSNSTRFHQTLDCSSNLLADSADIYIKDIRVQGSIVQFIYTTWNNYTAGITLNTRTTLNFRFNITHADGWELYLKASSNEILYDGPTEVPVVPNIPLNSLTINAVLSCPGDGAPIIVSPFPLSDTFQILASGKGDSYFGLWHNRKYITNGTVILSYTLPSMMDVHEGFYYVNLEFLLVETPFPLVLP